MKTNFENIVRKRPVAAFMDFSRFIHNLKQKPKKTECIVLIPVLSKEMKTECISFLSYHSHNNTMYISSDHLVQLSGHYNTIYLSVVKT